MYVQVYIFLMDDFSFCQNGLHFNKMGVSFLVVVLVLYIRRRYVSVLKQFQFDLVHSKDRSYSQIALTVIVIYFFFFFSILLLYFIRKKKTSLIFVELKLSNNKITNKQKLPTLFQCRKLNSHYNLLRINYLLIFADFIIINCTN